MVQDCSSVLGLRAVAQFTSKRADCSELHSFENPEGLSCS